MHSKMVSNICNCCPEMEPPPKKKKKSIVLHLSVRPRLEKCAHNLRYRHKNADLVVCNQEKGHTLSTTIPSCSPIDQLTRITLKALHLRKIAWGEYLVLRTLELAKQVNGITTIVEDHEGNVVIFCVYNLTDELNPDLSDILPIGTVFLLKEPYINETKKTGDCFLRCDCPSDMIVVYRGHPLHYLTRDIVWTNHVQLADDVLEWSPKPSTAQEWLELGDILLEKGRFHQATRCYYQAQHIREVLKDDLWHRAINLKVAEAFFRRGCFEKTLELATSNLGKDPQNKEASFLAGRSCYQLRNFEAAIGHLKQCQDVEGGMEELRKAEKRHAENKGNFDSLEHFLNMDSKPRKLMDCAKYTGPLMRLKKIRGFRVRKDVEAGTMLMVSKAYAFSWKSNVKPDSGQFFETGSWQHLLAQVAQLILKNPATFGNAIYGINYGRVPYEYSKDVSQDVFCDPEDKTEPIVDVRILKRLIDHYTHFRTTRDNDVGEDDNVGLLKDGVGLSTMVNDFKHSCLPNAVAHACGDVIFVRAIQNIRSYGEVYLPYISWEVPFGRRSRFCDWYLFKCPCHLCKLDKNDDMRIRHEMLIKKFKDLRREICEENYLQFETLAERIDVLYQEFIEGVENFYQCPISVQDALVSLPYVLLIRLYALENKIGVWRTDHQIECYKTHLKLRNFDPDVLLDSHKINAKLVKGDAVLDDAVFESVVGLIRVYGHINDQENVNNWIPVLCALEKMYSNGDMRVLKYKFKDIEHILAQYEDANYAETQF